MLGRRIMGYELKIGNTEKYFTAHKILFNLNLNSNLKIP